MNDIKQAAQPKPERPKPRRKEDDFSVKLTIDSDPFFWWRVEKTFDDTLLITDFTQGEQDDATMGAALADLILAHGATRPARIVFHNLVPGPTDDPNAYRIRLNQITQAVQVWISRAAEIAGVRLSDTQLETHRGKARMVVMLE